MRAPSFWLASPPTLLAQALRPFGYYESEVTTEPET